MRACSWFLCALVGCGAAPSLTRERPGLRALAEEGGEPGHWVLGAAGLGLASFVRREDPRSGREEREEELLFGGKLFLERALVPEWLELEASAGAVWIGRGPAGLVVPLELLLKVPFQLTSSIHPYLGAGVALDIEHLEREEETRYLPGLSAAAGGYLWFSDALGLDLELSYTLLAEEEHTGRALKHELGLGVGFVTRF